MAVVIEEQSMSARTLILFFVLLGLAGCGGKPPPSMGPPQVTVATPLVRQITDWDEYTGRLAAVDSVEIRPRVSGYLKSVHFEDGALVKRGDLLFTIDPRPYEAALDEARADLTQAKVRLELASNDLDRAKRLFTARAISEEELDARTKAHREAEAFLEAAQAAEKGSALNLEFARIRAPISGRISRKLVTGSKFDVQWNDLGKRYAFGFAAFDNAQVRHATADEPSFLVFGK